MSCSAEHEKSFLTSGHDLFYNKFEVPLSQSMNTLFDKNNKKFNRKMRYRSF